MEWKKLLYGCVGLFAACACRMRQRGRRESAVPEPERHRMYFTGEDNLPFTVTVYAYADWTAESDASWAKVGDKTAESSR